MRKPFLLLLAAVAAAAAVAAKPMPDEFSHQFRNGVASNLTFRASGLDVKQVAKTDGQGLRITLSSKRQDKTGMLAIRSAFGMRGDCEMTLGFDLLSTENPLQQSGAGIVLMVEVAGPEGWAVALSRFRWPGKDGRPPVDTFGASLITRKDGGDTYDTSGDTYDTKRVPATANSGRLRLERNGEVVKVLVADGANAEFKLIREIPVGTSDLHSLSAQCQAKNGGVDVRFTDLTVRAESLIDEAAVTHRGRFRWVPWAIGAVVLVGVAAWLLLRRTRGKEPMPPSEAEGPALPRPVREAANGKADSAKADGAKAGSSEAE